MFFKFSRFLQFWLLCLVTAHSKSATFKEWIGTGVLVLGLLSPWVISSIGERNSRDLLRLISDNKELISWFFIWLIAVRTLWNAFAKWDALNRRLKPKLELFCSPEEGCVTDNTGGGYGHNRAFTVCIKSVCDMDIELCHGVLTGISRNGSVLWRERAVLPVAPSEDDESCARRIHSLSTHQINVIFLDFNGSQVISKKPGAPKWNYGKTFDQLFTEDGEYLLDFRVEAKDMRPEICQLRFTLAGLASKMEFA
jgi:hypothetical protein